MADANTPPLRRERKNALSLQRGAEVQHLRLTSSFPPGRGGGLLRACSLSVNRCRNETMLICHLPLVTNDKHLLNWNNPDRDIPEREGGDLLVLGQDILGGTLGIIGDRGRLSGRQELAESGGVTGDNGDLHPVDLEVLPHGGVDLIDGQLGQPVGQLGDSRSFRP